MLDADTGQLWNMRTRPKGHDTLLHFRRPQNAETINKDHINPLNPLNPM